MGLILDTNFIVTAERRSRGGQSVFTDNFFATQPGESFFITFTIAGELACGRTAANRFAWERLCEPFSMLPWSAEVSWRYGELYRQLQSQGKMIGVNDLWIAATALVYQMDLVTNNVDEFRRVEGLTVVPF